MSTATGGAQARRDRRMANATTRAERRNTAHNGANGGQSTATDAERGQILGPGFSLLAAGGWTSQSDQLQRIIQVRRAGAHPCKQMNLKTQGCAPGVST